MYHAAIKLLLWLSMIVENEHTVCASDGLKIRLANGTVLKHFQSIYLRVDEPLELYCTGEARDLQMIDWSWSEKLPTTVVNGTAIRLFVQRPGPGITHYECQNIRTNNSTVALVQRLAVPKTTDFRCQSKNLEYLNCTWAIPEEVGYCKSSLFYVKDGHSTLLCNVNDYDYIYTPFCLWDEHRPLIPYDVMADTLTFTLESCNGLGCTNETFTVDHYAVVKPDPPKLEQVDTSSHSATLQWFIGLGWLFNSDTTMSYWYPGKEPVAVNTTSLQNQRGTYINYVLELPCANTYYEVRVSVRPSAAKAVGFWSDDEIIGFVTDPDPDDVDAGNPACKPEEIKLSPEIMMYKIAELRAKITEEQRELKESIRALKSKQTLNGLDDEYSDEYSDSDY